MLWRSSRGDESIPGADYLHLVTFKVRATVVETRRVLPASIAQLEQLDDG